ncbi:hypothetical protein ABLN73_05990 [Mycobacterium tuberculosis]
MANPPGCSATAPAARLCAFVDDVVDASSGVSADAGGRPRVYIGTGGAENVGPPRYPAVAAGCRRAQTLSSTRRG